MIKTFNNLLHRILNYKMNVERARLDIVDRREVEVRFVLIFLIYQILVYPMVSFHSIFFTQVNIRITTNGHLLHEQQYTLLSVGKLE